MTRDRIPPAPRCFPARDQWLEFVVAADAVKLDDPAPRPWLPNGTWNPEFHPCPDCTQQYEAEMVRDRRCQRGAFTWTPPRVQASLLETA